MMTKGSFVAVATDKAVESDDVHCAVHMLGRLNCSHTAVVALFL